MTLKVLGRVTSINVRKVLWAADEMGLSYEREEWGKPGRDPSVPEFLKLNPNAQVPVIVEEGFVLWESHAILRYLAQRKGSDLWPAAGRERALVDQWMSWQSSELNPAWSYANAAQRGRIANPDAARVAESIKTWTKEQQILEAWLMAQGAYMANGRFSLADIVIGLSTHRWMVGPFDKPRLPAIEGHYRAMLGRPAAKGYLGEGTP